MTTTPRKFPPGSPFLAYQHLLPTGPALHVLPWPKAPAEPSPEASVGALQTDSEPETRTGWHTQDFPARTEILTDIHFQPMRGPEKDWMAPEMEAELKAYLARWEAFGQRNKKT